MVDGNKMKKKNVQIAVITVVLIFNFIESQNILFLSAHSKREPDTAYRNKQKH